MKMYRLSQLPDICEGHFLAGIVDGAAITKGGMGFKKPGERTHAQTDANGSDRHVHDDCEIFVLLQGKAVMEIDENRHQLTTGDICVVEPGENHHLVADQQFPCVNLWLHCGDKRE